MKNCEIIRNVATGITFGALGTIIFGSLFMSIGEIAIAVLIALASGSTSFIMDKIANEKL